MLNNLAITIQEWQDKGNWTILLADMNKDVSGSTIQEFCQTINLVEAINGLHGRLIFMFQKSNYKQSQGGVARHTSSRLQI